MGLFSFTQEIAMDLGTANTIIITNGKIVVDEPSVVALDRRTDKMIAVGEKAKLMHEKTHENIRTIRPLRDGVIADFYACEQMMRGLIKQVNTRNHLFSPSLRMVIGVPSGSTEVELRAVRDSAEHAGGRDVYLIFEPMAAAIGIGIDVEAPEGNMIVDIGGGVCGGNNRKVFEGRHVIGHSRHVAVFILSQQEHVVSLGSVGAADGASQVGLGIRAGRNNIDIEVRVEGAVTLAGVEDDIVVVVPRVSLSGLVHHNVGLRSIVVGDVCADVRSNSFSQLIVFGQIGVQSLYEAVAHSRKISGAALICNGWILVEESFHSDGEVVQVRSGARDLRLLDDCRTAGEDGNCQNCDDEDNDNKLNKGEALALLARLEHVFHVTLLLFKFDVLPQN